MKKSKKYSFVSGISTKSGIPFDMLTSKPLIKMTSNREIIIEDAGVLVDYSEDCVKLTQRTLEIDIFGKGLKIKCLTNNSICVYGCIYSISFDGEGFR